MGTAIVILCSSTFVLGIIIVLAIMGYISVSDTEKDTLIVGWVMGGVVVGLITIMITTIYMKL